MKILNSVWFEAQQDIYGDSQSEILVQYIIKVNFKSADKMWH